MKNKNRTKTKLIILCCLWLAASSSVKAAIISYERTANGVNFILDKGRMQLNLFGSDIVQVRYTLLDAWEPKKSLVVKAAFETDLPARTTFTLTENGHSILITTARLKIVADRLTNAITYTDLSGNVLLAEDGANGKTMKAVTLVGTATYTCSTSFRSPKGEGLFGLGCHPLDTLSINYKGRDQDMAIKYLTGAIPVLLSTRGYGLLWDNYSESHFYGTGSDNTKFRYGSESGRMIDYYFFFRPSFTS